MNHLVLARSKRLKRSALTQVEFIRSTFFYVVNEDLRPMNGKNHPNLKHHHSFKKVSGQFGPIS